VTAAILRLLARLRLVTPALRYSPPDDGSLRRLVSPKPDDDFRTALIREGAEP
jgi:hypothetical protein